MRNIIRIFLFLVTILILRGCGAGLAQNRILPDHLDYTNDIDNQIRFVYPDTFGNLYLRQLRNEYLLNELVEDCNSDIEKAYRIVDWTSKRWNHSATNKPPANDALTILREAKQGQRYRCVEYSIVLSASLNSIGLKARILGLKSKNAETSEYGAGHVVTEVYIKDFNKWVMADGQFNVIPFKEYIPLNAVELQNSLADGMEINLFNSKGRLNKLMENMYLNFIRDYLYYFDVPFDSSPEDFTNKLKIDGKTNLMLVPVGAKKPVVFQITQKLDYCFYTNSISDFYKIP